MKAQTERKGVLVLSLGTEGEEMQAGVDRFLAVLQAHAPATLEWHYLPLPDESHATILHRAIYRSMEILYGKTHPGM